MPPLFLAEFAEVPDVIVDADDNVHAEKILIAAGIKDTPIVLVRMPSGVFVAEVIENEIEAEDGVDEVEVEEGDAWTLRPFQALEVLLDQRANLARLIAPEPPETMPEIGGE